MPSRHRFNLGLALDRGRLLGGLTLNYMSEAFWTDVLGPPYWGPTPAHTLLGASLGVRLARTHLTLMLKGTNLLDEDVQYNVFGDIVKKGGRAPGKGPVLAAHAPASLLAHLGVRRVRAARGEAEEKP